MLQRDDNYLDAWFATKKFDNGFYGYFNIGTCIDMPEHWYSVCLSVSNKKRKALGYVYGTKFSQTLKTNIGSGIAPLLWAKDCLLEFEEMKKEENYLKRDLYIGIFSDDARRHKVYKWGLSKIGFVEGIHFGKRCLVKRIPYIDKNE